MSSSMDGRTLAVIASTAPAAASTEAKIATSVLAGPGAGTSRSVTSVITPSVPSLPTNSLVEREPGDVLQPRPAQPHRGAVGEHDLHAEHVVGGDAVLDAAQPAGVRGGVAADGADLERRRVRRVPQPVLGGGFLDLRVEHAGLGDSHPADRVDGDGAHLLQAEHDPPSTAVDPPDSPEPAPRGTTGTRCALAQRSTACTSSVQVARTTASGTPGVLAGSAVLPVTGDHLRVGTRAPAGRPAASSASGAAPGCSPAESTLEEVMSAAFADARGRSAGAHHDAASRANRLRR